MKFTFAPESRPLDGFTIKRAIHRGGFGEVYYALSDAGKEVALKLLQQDVEVELRGVQQCLNLKHHNLVTIFDVRTDGDGDHWVVMEFVSGKNLDAVIRENLHGMPMEQVRHWLSGIVAGMGYLHSRGIVHRDLKPANIFSEGGTVKVGDVGLSKFISPSRRSAHTQSVGTVYYMAPEVAKGRYGREVDVYGLAVILYEMLTGRVPFEGETTAEILLKHLTAAPDLSPLAERIRPVIARALVKDPHERTASVEQLEQEFTAAVLGQEVTSPKRETPVVGSPSTAGSDRQTPTSDVRFFEETQPGQDSSQAKHSGNRHSYAPRPKPKQHQSHQSQTGETPWQWARMAAVVVLILAFIAPGALTGMTRAVFWVGAFCLIPYAFYRLVCFGITLLSYGLREISPHPPGGSDGKKSQHSTGHERVVLHSSPRQSLHQRIRLSELTPKTLRSISFRDRISDLVGSMTFAVLCTTILTGGLALLTSHFFQSGLTSAVDPASVFFFGLVTLLGSWAVLISAKFTEGIGVDKTTRRMTLLFLGGLVGAAAYGLDELLMISIPYSYFNRPQGIFSWIGRFPLLDQFVQPTLAGYIVFFAGLFALRRWWWHADGFRIKRFRVWSLMCTVMLGYLLTIFWTFPQVWAMTWAAAISSVVQLSSVWLTPEQKMTMMENSQKSALRGGSDVPTA